jgi:hypothetical protein
MVSFDAVESVVKQTNENTRRDPHVRMLSAQLPPSCFLSLFNLPLYFPIFIFNSPSVLQEIQFLLLCRGQQLDLFSKIIFLLIPFSILWRTIPVPAIVTVITRMAHLSFSFLFKDVDQQDLGRREGEKNRISII